MLRLVAAVIWLLAGSVQLSAQPYTFSRLAEDLVDLEALTRVDFTLLKMESSYDRAGANDDGSNFNQLKDGVYTIADLKGPGVVRRFYSARPGGHLRIFLDGDMTPVIDMPCEEFFSGKNFPFVRPAVGPMGRANYCYFPIPYAKSIRIETTSLDKVAGKNSYGRYYQVTHETLPENAVESLRLPLTTDQAAVWKRVMDLWKHAGEDPQPTRAMKETVSSVSVEPGKAVFFGELTGPGMIHQIHLQIDSEEPQLLRTTLLRIRWDDGEDWSVDCPVGDFFGNAFSRIPYRSLAMGLTQQGYYCYFRMPFDKKAQIGILNESVQYPIHADMKIVYRSSDGMEANQGYFCAKWRREEVVAVNLHGSNKTGEYNYRILDVHGKGRYIGANLNVFSRNLSWWGEGDPMILVDDEGWPSSFPGTGTEEYFNDAWGFNRYITAPGADPSGTEASVIPVSGVLVPGIGEPTGGGGGCSAGNAAFTFHLTDSVPFKKRILVTVEHGTENNMTNDYSSTAYWYARPGAKDFFFMRPVEERQVVLPEEWPAFREEVAQHYGLELLRQLADVVASVRAHPTDAQRYGYRLMILARTTRYGEHLGLSAEEIREFLKHYMELKKGGPEAEWVAIDEVLLELGERLSETTGW